MQFYDTPRSLKEALAASYAPKNQSQQNNPQRPPIEGAFGNYDFPQAGAPMPVYRKPCGCIMKLVTEGGGGVRDQGQVTGIEEARDSHTCK